MEISGGLFGSPAAGFMKAGAGQEPRRAIKVKETAAPAARRLLEKKMAIEKHGLYACEQRITAVQMPPACLNHAYFWIGKKINRAFEQVRLRNKISVQDADELTIGALEPNGQRARFESGAIH